MKIWRMRALLCLMVIFFLGVGFADFFGIFLESAVVTKYSDALM
jgi:hypothetical protein